MGSSGTQDGTLSLDEFCASAIVLAKRWQETDSTRPMWIWRPCCKMGASSKVEGYLALEEIYHLDDGSDGKNEQIGSDSKSLGEEIVDDVNLVESCDDEHVYDFHIVYSFSYRVPVLYFRGYQSDGRPLTLDEITKDLPPYSLEKLSESKWTFITQEEHPYLNRPWYTLHPCGTSNWMGLLLADAKSANKVELLQYLPAWLSVVGQAVGLKIPLGLYCNPS